MSRPSELVDQTMEPIGIAMSNPEASYNNEIDNNGNDILTEPVDEAPFEDDVHSVLTGDNADNNNNNDNNETVQSTTSSMRDNIAQLQMQFSNITSDMSNQFSNINDRFSNIDNQFSQMITMLSTIAPPPVALTPTVVAPTPTVATQPTTVVVQPSTVVAQPSIRRGSIRALNFSNVNMTRRSTNSLPGNRPSNREVTTPAPRGNPQLPREPRRSIGSNILMSPPPQPRTEVPIPTDQVVPTTSVTVAPPEVISTQPTQSSPTQASGLQSVIEVNRSSINLQPSYPPGVMPRYSLANATSSASTINSISSLRTVEEQRELKVIKQPPDELKLSTDPTPLKILKLLIDVEYFREQYEQNTSLAMFITKKVLQLIFNKEAILQSPLYREVGTEENMPRQPDDVILQLLVNSVLPQNKPEHARAIFIIAKTGEYSLEEVLFNAVGYHEHTFLKVEKFLAVMLKLHRLFMHNITLEKRQRLLEESFSKEKPPIGVINMILHAMKSLKDNFVTRMKLDQIKKFTNVEDFIQALKDMNGKFAMESKAIQDQRELSRPMKDLDDIFSKADQKTAEYKKGVPNAKPPVSGATEPKKFWKYKSKVADSRVRAMEFTEEGYGEELSDEASEGSSAEEASHQDSDEDEDEARRKDLARQAVQDADGQVLVPMEAALNYVARGATDSKFKKVDTKTQPCFRQMKSQDCPDGDKCAYSHAVAIVGKRLNDDIIQNQANPIYKEYKAAEGKSKAYIKKVERADPSTTTISKTQPSLRLLSASASAPSQIPRNFNPAVESKIQVSQPPGNTSGASTQNWG